MNTFRKSAIAAIPLFSSLTLTLVSAPLQAQSPSKPQIEVPSTSPKPQLEIPSTPEVPSKPQLEIDGTNIDDLPNDSQQLRTWGCRHTDKAIAVEAKDISRWKELIEGEGWLCEEEVPIIADNDRKFSCEPDNTGEIAIITVFWLEGEGGKQQMQTWMDELANSESGMACTADRTNPFWE